MLKANDLIVFEGDSLSRRQMRPSADTWAFARISGWDRSFGEIVEEWLFTCLPEQRIRARHAAIGGSKMTDLHERYERCVKVHRPQWIVLTAGSNDMSQGVCLADFSASLDRYVQTAQSDGATCVFAGGLLAMPGITDAGFEKITRCQPYYDAAREIIRKSGGIAPHMGKAMLAKAQSLYDWSTYHTFYADGNHLNALGTRVLAALVLQAIGAYELITPLRA